MRFLIVGVSLLFSFIFYLFYTANLGKNIFFQSSENVFYGKTLLWSFIYFPILFLFLAVFFFFIFKWNKKTRSYEESDLYWEEENYLGPVQNKKLNTIFYYIIFWIFTWTIFYFLWFNFVYLLGIFSIFSLSHFFWRSLYSYEKIPNNLYVQINIFSIIFWYLFSIWSILFIYFYSEFQLFSQFQAILFYVWIGIMSFFHIYIHIRYVNIISLFIWVITFIFSLYSIIDNLFPWII